MVYDYVYGDAFGNDNNVTVYYLLGTTGWDVTFAGRPTVLWNLLIQASAPSFGVPTSPFGVNVTGTPNIPIVVEASRNLASASWTAPQTRPGEDHSSEIGGSHGKTRSRKHPGQRAPRTCDSGQADSDSS